ncbi:MAG: copper transporter [Halanaerobiaceae bacterium]
MIITFKQHVITITAIFASLCLGILVGSTIVGEDGLLLEQRKIINGIRNEIDNLELEKSKLADEVSILENELSTRIKMEEKIISLTLENFLEDKQYYLLYDNLENNHTKNKINDKVNEIQALIRNMGGEINLLYTSEFDNLLKKQENDIVNLIKWQNNKFFSYSNEQSFSEESENDNIRLIEYEEDSTLGLIYTIIKGEFNA